MDKNRVISIFQKPAKYWTDEDKNYINLMFKQNRRQELKKIREEVRNDHGKRNSN